MCTNIVHKVPMAGSGKGADGWFDVVGATVAFDHPFHAPLDHALSVDFTDVVDGLGRRVAVELSVTSARALAHAILAATDEAIALGLDEPHPAEASST